MKDYSQIKSGVVFLYLNGEISLKKKIVMKILIIDGGIPLIFNIRMRFHTVSSTMNM